MKDEYDFSEADRGAIVEKIKREGFTKVAPGHEELGKLLLATICPKLDDELRQHLEHYVALCNRMHNSERSEHFRTRFR